MDHPARSAFYAALGALTAAIRRNDGSDHDARMVVRAIEEATAPCADCDGTGSRALDFDTYEDCDCADNLTDADLDAAIEITEAGHVRDRATGAVCVAGAGAAKFIAGALRARAERAVAA